MDAAQSIAIQCDKGPAQADVAQVIVAAIGRRLGSWTVTVHERHGGHCWNVRILPPGGPEQQHVFLGEERSPGRIRRALEEALHGYPLEAPHHADRVSAR